MNAILKLPTVTLVVLSCAVLFVVLPIAHSLLTYLLTRSVPEAERDDRCFTESDKGHVESELEARFRKFQEAVDLEEFCRAGPGRPIPARLIAWSGRPDRESR